MNWKRKKKHTEAKLREEILVVELENAKIYLEMNKKKLNSRGGE